VSLDGVELSLLAAGLIGLSIATDRRWAAVRLILQAQALAVVLILAAIVLARRDFDWSAPTSWSFVAGLLAVFDLVVTVLLRYRGREPEHEVAEPPLETAGGG
jgi:membrane protein YdbS with pleckstrin-like domain